MKKKIWNKNNFVCHEKYFNYKNNLLVTKSYDWTESLTLNSQCNNMSIKVQNEVTWRITHDSYSRNILLIRTWKILAVIKGQISYKRYHRQARPISLIFLTGPKKAFCLLKNNSDKRACHDLFYSRIIETLLWKSDQYNSTSARRGPLIVCEHSGVAAAECVETCSIIRFGRRIRLR